MRKYRYSAVVVLYNPEIEVIENIYSYLEFVERVYIVDNSDKKNEGLVSIVKKIESCHYIDLNGNRGLGVALNEGCQQAIKDGFEYALTMDQDSKFATGAVSLMIEFLEREGEGYSIIAPNVKSLYDGAKDKKTKIAYTIIKDEEENVEENWVMSSGSLMKLEDYNSVGGFDDSLFIAHLDIDICYRLFLAGKKIIMLGKAIIYQRFGNSEPRKILHKTVHPSFASPVRTYYIFRNQVYMKKKYGKKVNGFINRHLYKFVLKILFFEQQKKEKIYMIVKGVVDGYSEVMGKYKN